jgi:hypothetical protein
MAFWDKPIVDRNSERSEDSVLKSQLFFSLKNGFNSHIVDGSKDYGVDIYCELINENGATGNIFPIQIKSTGKAQYIFKNSIKYFSFQFLTSRLGYLCRHTPSYGIIVFYNETDDTLYYDYLWEIYNRIRLEKKDDLWQNKSTVNIHIPEQNKVQIDLENIHKTFLNRFANTNTLIEEHGRDFDIPSFGFKKLVKSLKGKDRISKAINLLETIGPYLFNEREYTKIIGLLEILPKNVFYRPKISYIAAITYAELGDLLDADYFLKISFSKKREYTEEEFLALEMQRFKVDFSYGINNKNELIEKLKDIRKRTSNSDNLLNIDININMIEISQKIGNLAFDKNIINEIEDIFDRIGEISQNEEQKYFQKIFQSENLISVLTRIYADYLNDSRLLKYGRNLETLKIGNRELKEIMISFEKVVNIINESLEYAISNDNKLMKAHALHKLAVAFFSMNFSHFLNEKSPDNKSDALSILESTLSKTLSAYNLFLEIKVNQSAFIAITLAYETYRLSEKWIGESLYNVCSIDEIKKQIQSFHNFEFFNQFSSVIDKISNDSIGKNKPENLNDDELSILAERILKIRKIPNDRKANLIDEIKSFRYFENECKNEDLELLANQDYNGDLFYSVPTKYAIVSKKTGVIYSKGFNVKEMMFKLGLKAEDKN